MCDSLHSSQGIDETEYPGFLNLRLSSEACTAIEMASVAFLLADVLVKAYYLSPQGSFSPANVFWKEVRVREERSEQLDESLSSSLIRFARRRAASAHPCFHTLPPSYLSASHIPYPSSPPSSPSSPAPTSGLSSSPPPTACCENGR